jgi:hypothetical protein
VTSEFAAARRPTRAWLEWAEWLALLAALACWLASSDYSAVMVVGVGGLGLAWLAHYTRTGVASASTPLDAPLVVYLAGCLVGLWVAPDGQAALVRLYWFTGAAALYATLAGSRPAALRWAAAGLVTFGGLLAVYFVTQNPWATAPAKFAIINRLGQAISAATPSLGAYQPHPNVVASLLALLLPVALALALGAWQARSMPQLLAALAGVGLVGVGLVFTESRSSVLAVGVAALLGGWGWLAYRWTARQGVAFGPVFAAPVALALVGLAAALVLRPNLLALLLGTLPGPNSVVSRQVVFGQAWRLAQDVAFTGGGLASFPARYSTYVLDVPVVYLTHAHDAYLNVLVEQGWLGLIGYVSLLAGAAWFGLRRVLRGAAPEPALAVAGLLGLVIVAVQGVGDATLVASRVAPFWLVPAGLALGGWSAPSSTDSGWWSNRWARVGAVAAVLLVAVLAVANRAAWHANRGALISDEVLLYGFPTGEWRTGREAAALRAAEPEFEQALALDPHNRTAHFYLGLAAMLRRDYATAVEQLSAAHATDPDHRGVQKALGYSLAWQGQFAEAAAMLQGIPEARSEMEIYAWWWGTQGRPDLADDAAAMLAYFSAGS